MSKNKVFYGEYSLKHWIDLILKKDIIIPEYQRYFVWNEEQVKKFIMAIKEEQFIPPVTIGFYNGANLIIDGQQRLTSLFLSYLSIFPNRDKFKASETSSLASSTNNNEDNFENDEDNFENVIEWKLEALTKLGKTKEDISKKVGGSYKYFESPVDLSEDFLKKHFLGFSYIVPNYTNEKETTKYFSSLFKNMNTQGIPLSRLESRESLYYISSDLRDFFKPSFIKKFKVNGETIDFVRILSFLFQYYKDDEAYDRLAKGYIRGRKNIENYYEEYIFDVINDNDGLFGKFSDIFPERNYLGRLSELESVLSELNVPKKLLSIVDADIYFFGMVYLILIKKRTFNNTDFGKLSKKLKKKIEGYPKDKSPNQIGKIKERIKSSINIYEEALENDET